MTTAFPRASCSGPMRWFGRGFRAKADPMTALCAAASAVALVLVAAASSAIAKTPAPSSPPSQPPAADVMKVDVLTQRYDATRRGANLKETQLTPAVVGSGRFHRLFSRHVEGQIYAQPLVVTDIAGPDGRRRDVVIVATMKNRVYALDADNKDAPDLWPPRQLEPPVSLAPDAPTPRIGGVNYRDIVGSVGILGTPVISRDLNRIYLVTATRPADFTFEHWLHALDLTTGADVMPPVKIEGNVDRAGARVPPAPLDASGRPQAFGGAADPVRRPHVWFSSYLQIQRPGLLLSKGRIYVAFGAYGDADLFSPAAILDLLHIPGGPWDVNYHGWVMAYDARTLALEGMFNTSPASGHGGIWQAGGGLVSNDDGTDETDGTIYFSTGNGRKGGALPALGDAVVALTPNLVLKDWFAPTNQEDLDKYDCDLGSSGPVLLSSGDIVSAGKEALLYLLDAGRLGSRQRDPDAALPIEPRICGPRSTEFVDSRPVPAPSVAALFGPTAITHHVHGAPVVWERPGGEVRLYVWPENAQMTAISVQGRTLARIGSTDVHDPEGVDGGSRGMPGGSLTLSASGAAEGIVWSTHPWRGDSLHATRPGVLRAFDAMSLCELWNSRRSGEPGSDWTYAKFASPTVANGKVFVPTFNDELVVYGIDPAGNTTAVRTTCDPPGGGR